MDKLLDYLTHKIEQVEHTANIVNIRTSKIDVIEKELYKFMDNF